MSALAVVPKRLTLHTFALVSTCPRYRMIDLAKEGPPISLAEVPRQRCVPRRPGGKTIHLATVHRWATIGIKGVVLETLQCGRTKCTTTAAIQRFFERLSGPWTDPASNPSGGPRTRRKANSAIAEAERVLDRAGVGGGNGSHVRGCRAGVET